MFYLIKFIKEQKFYQLYLNLLSDSIVLLENILLKSYTFWSLLHNSLVLRLTDTISTALGAIAPTRKRKPILDFGFLPRPPLDKGGKIVER
jgi:hypothetical protein